MDLSYQMKMGLGGLHHLLSIILRSSKWRKKIFADFLQNLGLFLVAFFVFNDMMIPLLYMFSSLQTRYVVWREAHSHTDENAVYFVSMYILHITHSNACDIFLPIWHWQESFRTVFSVISVLREMLYTSISWLSGAPWSWSPLRKTNQSKGI